MNCIILPPTPEEVAEYEKKQKEFWEDFDRKLEETTKEVFAPVKDALKDVFNTVELFGMRLRIVEGVDCENCVFCANKEKLLCKMHFNGKTPCKQSGETSNRHFELIREGGEK